MSYNEGDILAGSLAVKVGLPSRMSPRLVIGQEGDILAGSLPVKVSEPTRMSPFNPFWWLVVVVAS